MKYIIHSKSEKGFWHNKIGWVYRASSATKFKFTKEQKDLYRLPNLSCNDAEWMVYDYDDN